MHYRKNQGLNEWAVMLDAIYGSSQNYAKTPYEVHAHLTEVCGVFAKHLFKRRDIAEATKFLPKIFAWTTALMRKVHPGQTSLEDIVLRKFPNACPYCLNKPCSCWTGEKPTLDDNQLRDAFFQRAPGMKRSVNDFQLMFREIYGQSWLGGLDPATQADEISRRLFIRLIEELAEAGEALRFHHLYPENFDNELSDLLAWWFALVSTLPASSSGGMLLAEDCLWGAYPGQCPDCQMVPCLCRPGPVRQLMSRPIPGHGHRFDSLTSLLNQAAYKEDITSVTKGTIVLPQPSACVRMDVDNFKRVNDTFGHAAGDHALRHIAAIVRRTVRERDRVYRISGDEFGVLCANFTEEEAAGAMRRVCSTLSAEPVRWVDRAGKESSFTVSVSIGVAEFNSPDQVSAAFEAADQASYASKQAGKGTVRRASEPIAASPT